MKRTLAILIAVMLTLQLAAQDGIRILHGPYLQNVTETEATIVWVSNKTSVGWAELAPDDDSQFYMCARPRFYDTKNGIKTESTIHSVLLTGLKPGTKYRYRVCSQEILSHVEAVVSYGGSVSTDVYDREPLEFVTSSPDKESVSFAMVNDNHGRTRRMEKLFANCDLSKTDMVLFVGDMASSMDSEEQIFKDFMDTAVKLFASEKPMYYTRGNHETRGNIAYDFQNYFSTRSEHIYYMYRQGPVCFIALDCGEDKPDSDIEYSDINCYDEYRSEQAEWLKKVVETEEFKSAPFKVVTCHMPPPFGEGRQMHGNIEIGNKFMPILEKAGIDILLCAHLHESHHLKPGECASFPVIVNSDETILLGDITAKRLSIKILDAKGAIVDSFKIEK